MDKILDAWAVLAWINDEAPAAARVEAILDQAQAGRLQLGLSIVNAGEVFYRLAKSRSLAYAQQFWDDFQTAPVALLEVPNSLVYQAATWKARFPISYADAFAVATAVRFGAALVTGDPDLSAVSQCGEVRLEWIGRAPQ